MTIEKYLANLFGVKDSDIGNFSFNSETDSVMYLNEKCEPLFVKGLLSTKLQFCCIEKIEDAMLMSQFGSLRVVSEEYKVFTGNTYLWHYEVVCLKGKETNEIVKLIGDMYLC